MPAPWTGTPWPSMPWPSSYHAGDRKPIHTTTHPSTRLLPRAAAAGFTATAIPADTLLPMVICPPLPLRRIRRNSPLRQQIPISELCCPPPLVRPMAVEVGQFVDEMILAEGFSR